MAPKGYNEHLSMLMNESFKALAWGELSENPACEPLTVAVDACLQPHWKTTLLPPTAVMTKGLDRVIAGK